MTVLLVNLYDEVTNLPKLTKGYRHVGSLFSNGIIVFYGNKYSYIDNHVPSTYYSGIDSAKYIKGLN